MLAAPAHTFMELQLQERVLLIYIHVADHQTAMPEQPRYCSQPKLHSAMQQYGLASSSCLALLASAAVYLALHCSVGVHEPAMFVAALYIVALNGCSSSAALTGSSAG